MTYRPRTIDEPTAAEAVLNGDLVPWREAAQHLEVKPATLARWIDRGKLPTITINRRRYVSLTDASTLEHATRHRR